MPPSSTRPSARQYENDVLAQAAALKARLISALDVTDPAFAAQLRNEPNSPAQATENPEPPSPCPASRKSRAASASPNPDESNLSALERHSRKCKICNHPNREAFEADFLDWCQASWLQRTYHIRDEATIYRHARATGLLQRRRENVRMVAEKILEHVDSIDTPSAFAILRAVRTLACLNERGQWAEPSTTHVVVNTANPPAESASPVAVSGSLPSSDSMLSISQHPASSPVAVFGASADSVSSSAIDTTGESRQAEKEVSSHSPLVTSHCLPNRQSYEKLELDVTDTKHTPEVISNRQ